MVVHPKLVPGCEWVLDYPLSHEYLNITRGVVLATRKLDGTACMCDEGDWYKRYDCKKGRTAPEGFIPCDDPDPVTGHWPGWVSVDAWRDPIMEEALGNIPDTGAWESEYNGQRTYELVGPKVNGNNDGFPFHMLIPHGTVILDLDRGYVRSKYATTPEEILFDKVKQYLTKNVIEGIVFHGPDGEMCKIKR